MKARAFALGLLCLGASQAYGQSYNDSIFLEEVVITSTYNRPSAVSKMPVPLKKAPLSVSVVQPTKLEDLQLNSLIEVANNTTGIRSNNSYGGFQTFIIRGFSDFVLLNDGIRDERHNLYASAPSTSLASVERIEVLKGAASVMFGHSALGGVINIVHKQPTPTKHVNAKMSIGSWGQYQVAAGASGAISSNLSFRTDFSMSGGDGWRHTNDKAYNAYLALDWKMNDRNNLLFSVSAKDDYYGTDTGQPHFSTDIYNLSGQKVYGVNDIPSEISRRTRYNDPLDHLTDKDITLRAFYTHNFKNPDWNLTDNISYYQGDLDYYASETLGYVTSSEPIYDNYYMSGDKKVYIDTKNIQRKGFYFQYDTHLFQNQLEINGKALTGSVEHNLLGGYSYSNLLVPRYRGNWGKDATGPGTQAFLSTTEPVLNQGNIVAPFTTRQTTWEQDHGIYVGDYLKIAKGLSALVSLRFDHFNRTYEVASTYNKEVKEKSPKTHERDNALTYRLSLSYDITKDINVYASTSNFFKPTRTTAASGYIYIGSDGKVIKPNNDNVFKPISGYQYEVGSHIGIGGWFAADIAAYYIRKNNMVQNLGKLEDGTQISGQVGGAESKGFEVSIFAEPVRNLTFDMGYTLTIAKLTDYAKNEYAGNTQKGNYLTLAPKNMAYGWAFYQFSQALSGLKIGVGFNYNSKAYVNAANTMWFDAYAIANAMASYKLKNWKLQVNLNNIFDKTYYTTAVSTTGFVPEQGRNVMFTASFDL